MVAIYISSQTIEEINAKRMEFYWRMRISYKNQNLETKAMVGPPRSGVGNLLSSVFKFVCDCLKLRVPMHLLPNHLFSTRH